MTEVKSIAGYASTGSGAAISYSPDPSYAQNNSQCQIISQPMEGKSNGTNYLRLGSNVPRSIGAHTLFRTQSG